MGEKRFEQGSEIVGRQTATDRERMQAVAAYAITNNFSEAGRLANVDDKTVSKWVSDSPEMLEKIRQALQAEFMPELVSIGRVLLTRLAEVKSVPVNTARDAQSLAVTFGIIVDKMAVLLGLPSRVEHFGSIDHNISGLEERERNIEERRAALRAQYGEIIDVEYRVRPE